MTRPRIVVAPHLRTLDTPLGRLRAALAYEEYLQGIVDAGGEPLVVWPGSEDLGGILDLADGVMLVGGGDIDPARFGSDADGDGVDPQRDTFELALVRGARERSIPVLGMCRGCQTLNVALGGELREVGEHRQEEALTAPHHRVEVVTGSRLAETVGGDAVDVNSFHRWAPGALGEGLVASAFAHDDVVEAIESGPGWWALGVQWHAELLGGRAAATLFEGLVRAAADHRAERAGGG